MGPTTEQRNAHSEEQFLTESERSELGALLYIAIETFKGVDSDYLYAYRGERRLSLSYRWRLTGMLVTGRCYRELFTSVPEERGDVSFVPRYGHHGRGLP
jgi:hypothetical protein